MVVLEECVDGNFEVRQWPERLSAKWVLLRPQLSKGDDWKSRPPHGDRHTKKREDFMLRRPNPSGGSPIAKSQSCQPRHILKSVGLESTGMVEM